MRQQLSFLTALLFTALFLLQQAKAQNTAYGFQALQSNTTGYGNSAFGRSALYSNTSGFSNTASGFQALPSSALKVLFKRLAFENSFM
jgi:hypothetical protein